MSTRWTRLSEKQKESIRVYRRSWRENNKDRLNQETRERRAKDPDSYRTQNLDGHLRRKYGVKPEVYYKMVADQDNKCGLCGKPEHYKYKGKVLRLSVDHDHATSKLRKLLCFDCNAGLAKFHESVELLQAAIAYLKRYSSA